MKTREQLEREWNRLIYIKKILYGLGIPPRDAQISKDLSSLQKQYTAVINHQSS